MSTYNTTVISSQAFLNNNVIMNVKANSILSVEEEAFENCTSLNDVQMSSCTTIMDNAFNGCEALRKIDALSVKDIGNYAFYDDHMLSSYDFPECSSIGVGAFKMYINSGKTIKNGYINFPKCKEIGDSAFELSCIINSKIYAFNNVTELDFPSCDTIGDYAFQIIANEYVLNANTYCYLNLKKLNFPRCKSIGEYAFSVRENGDSQTTYVCNTYLRSISSLYFPECLAIGTGAFYQKSEEKSQREQSLKEIRFPKCVTIGNYAFARSDMGKDQGEHMYECNVSSVEFPKCEIVGSNAFRNFTIDSHIDMNLSSCLSVLSKAFYDASFMSSINLDQCKLLQGNTFAAGKHSFQSINLPKIESIDKNEFASMTCQNLTSICFGKSLSSIGITNFNNISNKNITLSIDSENPYFEVVEDSNMIYSKTGSDTKGKGLIEAYLCKNNEFDDNTDYVRRYASYNNRNILSVNILQCKSIEEYAFAYCNNLTSITLDNVSSVGQYAFYNADIKEPLNLPNCLRIEEKAFSNTDNNNKNKSCPSIILKKCQYIGRWAFSNDSDTQKYYRDYRTVCIPSCLSVGYQAFTDNSAPTKTAIQLGTTIPTFINKNGEAESPTSSNATNYFKEGFTLHVPDTKLKDYQSAFGGSYTYSTYSSIEEPSFQGYYYKGDSPVENEATILKMTFESAALTKDAVIPSEITEEN